MNIVWITIIDVKIKTRNALAAGQRIFLRCLWNVWLHENILMWNLKCRDSVLPGRHCTVTVPHRWCVCRPAAPPPLPAPVSAPRLPTHPPANLSSDWQETVCRVWGPGQDKEAAQLMYVWQCGNLVLASPHRCTVANSESSQSRASHSLFRLKERYGIINSRPAKKLTVRPHGPPCFGINNSDLSN